MQGALKITYTDGSEDYFEVDPVEGGPDIASNLKAFLESPNVTLFCSGEVIIIPSTSIRHLSITQVGNLPAGELESMPGVIVGARRVVG